MALPVGGGIGGLVLLLLFSALTGTNPMDMINTSEPDGEVVGTTGVRDSDPEAEFISVVLKDTEDIWAQIFRERGSTYQPPVLVLFTQATRPWDRSTAPPTSTCTWTSSSSTSSHSASKPAATSPRLT